MAQICQVAAGGTVTMIWWFAATAFTKTNTRVRILCQIRIGIVIIVQVHVWHCNLYSGTLCTVDGRSRRRFDNSFCLWPLQQGIFCNAVVSKLWTAHWGLVVWDQLPSWVLILHKEQCLPGSPDAKHADAEHANAADGANAPAATAGDAVYGAAEAVFCGRVASRMPPRTQL